jgi:hypothetical protein
MIYLNYRKQIPHPAAHDTSGQDKNFFIRNDSYLGFESGIPDQTTK